MEVRSKELITCDEFEKLAPTLGPCELIDGKINELTPGEFQHGFTASNITILIGNFVDERELAAR